MSDLPVPPELPIPAHLLRLVLKAFASLPFPLAQGLGAIVGWLAGRIPNVHRSIAERNLELCFPELSDTERRHLAQQVLVESGKTLTETLVLWLGKPERVRRLTREIFGEELLQAALAEGKGVLLCSPHLGAWEMISQELGARYAMTAMYRPPRYAFLDPIIRTARERTGSTLVPADAGGVRALYQALKEGKLVGVLPDQDPREPEGVFAPFFGIPANTITLVPRLAAKTGARVLFIFAERLPWARGFRMHILPAPEGIIDRDLERAAAAVNAAVEQAVRQVPSQYQWSYKRFRTRPPGSPPLY